MSESPIERMMREALEEEIGAKDVIAPAYKFDFLSVLSDEPDWPIQIYQEVKVDRYRLDFLIRRRNIFGKYDLIAVECDGHEYHDRSSIDAAKDKARDRFLSQLNITVLRFTGREIYSDARHYAKQVLELVEQRAADAVYTFKAVAEIARRAQ